MNCPNCHVPVGENDDFCYNCGCRLTGIPAGNGGYGHQDTAPDSRDYPEYNNTAGYEPAYEPNSGYPQYGSAGGYPQYGSVGGYPQPEPEEKSGTGKPNNRVMIAIIAVMAVIVVALATVLVVLLVRGRTNKPADNPVPAVTEDVVAQTTVPSVSVTDSSGGTLATVPGSSALVPGTSSVSGVIQPGAYRVTTQRDDLNIRSGPGSSYEVIGRIPKDTQVNVSAVNGEWAYVTYNGVSGWCSAAYLTKVVA